MEGEAEMKCPYQTITEHTPTADKAMFGDCIRIECPFYYTTEYKPANKVKEHCRRAEKEGK